MSTTETLLDLKVHKVSKESYDNKKDAGSLDDSALYLTPEQPLVIKLTENATTEGTDKFTYDGSEEKTVTIKTTDADIKLSEALYTYTPIGKAQQASNNVIGSGYTISNTNPGKLGDAGDSLKSVFNVVFGTQQDQQPTISTSGVKLEVSAGTTSYGGGEFGTAVAATNVTITFTLANSATASYGYRCGNTDTTGSQTFYYPVTKQSTGSSESGKTSADIKITLPYAISKVEDTTVSSVAYKKLTTVNGKNDTVTILTPAATYVSYSSKYLYCNFNSSKQVSIKVSLPAGGVTDSQQTRYEQISASVTLGAAQKENQLTKGTAITAFLTYLKAVADDQSKLTITTPKSNTAGSYTIAAGSYYPYYLTSTSTSLSSDTDNPVTTAIRFDSTSTSSSVSATLSSNAYVWFLLPPTASGSKTIQYEALGQWYSFNGGTTGPTDVALKLDSGVTVTYKGYRTTKQAAAGTTSFKIV